MEKDKNIPEIIGLTKKQFFGFLIANMLLGASLYGIGYMSGYFKSHDIHKKKDAKKKKDEQKKLNSLNNAPIALDHDQVSEGLTSGKDMIPGSEYVKYNNNYKKQNYHAIKTQNTYIILGIFVNYEDALLLKEKLEEKGNKTNIQNKDIQFIVFLGPYNSYNLAKNELDALESNTGLSGSLSNELP